MEEKNNVARTCVKQIPALFKKVPWIAGQRNLDIGGGKYDLGTNYLRDEHGVINFVYDPYNRPEGNNECIIKMCMSEPVDSVTVSNVLCVIEGYETRQHVIHLAYVLSRHDAPCYVKVYEGDKSGIGKRTKNGTFQLNRRLKDYVEEIQLVYPIVIVKNGYITALKR